MEGRVSVQFNEAKERRAPDFQPEARPTLRLPRKN
jgi:hypothetical protein